MRFYLHFLITLFSSGLFAQENSILWQAEKDDVKIYLLGANHLYPADSILNKEKINKLIENSDLYFGESNEDKDNRDSIFNSRKDNQIEKKLGQKEFKIYKNLFPDDKFVTKLSPEEVYFKLQRKRIILSCGFNNQINMDNYFDKIAKKSKVQIIGFEKIIDQLDQINDFHKNSDKELWKSNKKLLNDLGSVKFKECLDPALISKNNYVFDFEREIPSNQKQFWDDRNIKWISILEDNLSDEKYKTVFVKVGIGHLDYSNGLIMLLKNKGYQLTPITF